MNSSLTSLTRLLLLLVAAFTLSPATAQDLLGDNRANILKKFGSPQFAGRLGDEDHTEQFRVGDYRYIIGYRKDAQKPDDDTLMKIICVVKARDFGHATTLQPDEIRVALSDSRAKPTWDPYNPLPAEKDPKAKPAEKTRDFPAENKDKDTSLRTAGAQTGSRRKRVLTYTSEWHGIPEKAAASSLLDVPPELLQNLLKGFSGNIIEFQARNPVLPQEIQKVLDQ